MGRRARDVGGTGAAATGPGRRLRREAFDLDLERLALDRDFHRRLGEVADLYRVPPFADPDADSGYRQLQLLNERDRSCSLRP